MHLVESLVCDGIFHQIGKLSDDIATQSTYHSTDCCSVVIPSISLALSCDTCGHDLDSVIVHSSCHCLGKSGVMRTDEFSSSYARVEKSTTLKHLAPFHAVCPKHAKFSISCSTILKKLRVKFFQVPLPCSLSKTC